MMELIDKKRSLWGMQEARKKMAEIYLAGGCFWGLEEYFSRILARVSECLDGTNDCIGSYMCQGRMPQAVRDRYEAMEESPRRTAMLENFDRALSHPDQQDLDRLKAAVAQ